MKRDETGFQDIRSCRKCHECGLLYCGNFDAYPLFFESGNCESEIVFILEAPNLSDSVKGELTYDAETDPTGRFVRECLYRYLGMDPNDVYFTNAVLCLPKEEIRDGRTKYPVEDSQQKYCVSNVKKIVDMIDPRIVVTMGGIALQTANLIEHHHLVLMASVGTDHEWYNRTIFPMYHPVATISKEMKREHFQRLAEFIHHRPS